MSRARPFLAVTLLTVALVQTAALGKIVYDRVQLLRTGEEVVLKIRPRDPRDPLKGYYSSLFYDISQPDPLLLDGVKRDLATGDTVYVSLRTGPEGHAVPVGLSDRRPATSPGEVVARGRVRYVSGKQVNLGFGIEEFYLPQAEAARLDNIPVEDVRIVAAVGSDGTMAIKRLLVDGEPAYEEPPF